MNYAVRASVAQTAAQPARVRRIIAPGTPTRGFRSPDLLTPQELRAPGLALRLAELCAMPAQTVDRRLLGLGSTAEVTVPRLADWPLHVRPGTSDVAQLDLVCNGTRHLPPEEDLHEPALIVDLGASVGITALDLAKRYPSAHIVAVEMDAASVALCAENLRPLGDRVTVVGAAIADHDGAVEYSTAGDPAHHAVAEGGEGQAAAITLDTLLQHTANGRVVDYVKVNIEGSEPAVLRSGGRWPESVSAITVSVHADYDANDASADLRKLGFMAVAGDDRYRVCGIRHDARPWRVGLRALGRLRA